MELLERRLLLNGGAIGTIPVWTDPSTAVQAVYPPGQSLHTFQPAGTGQASQSYVFALDSVAYGNTVEFAVAPSVPDATLDAAMALYDGDGNLLQTVDDDASPDGPGVEASRWASRPGGRTS